LGRSFEELKFLATQHAGEFGPTVLRIIDSNADRARAVNKNAGRFPTDLANGASARFAIRAYESALVWSMLTGDPQYLNRAVEKLGPLARNTLGGTGAYAPNTTQVLADLQAHPGKSMSAAEVEGTLRQVDYADDDLDRSAPYPTHLPFDATPEGLERRAQTDPQAFRQNTLAEIDRAGQAALLVC